MPVATSPDVEGILITVDAAPGGTPAGAPSPLGHMETFDNLHDKSRAVKKYTPMNNSQFDEIVAMGSLTNGPFSFSVLYDPEASEGVNKLESAIDTNDEVQIILELNNSLGVNGTKVTSLCKVSSFKVTGEKDGKFLASVSAEKIGNPTVTAASAV